MTILGYSEWGSYGNNITCTYGFDDLMKMCTDQCHNVYVPINFGTLMCIQILVTTTYGICKIGVNSDELPFRHHILSVFLSVMMFINETFCVIFIMYLSKRIHNPYSAISESLDVQTYGQIPGNFICKPEEKFSKEDKKQFMEKIEKLQDIELVKSLHHQIITEATCSRYNPKICIIPGSLTKTVLLRIHLIISVIIMAHIIIEFYYSLKYLLLAKKQRRQREVSRKYPDGYDGANVRVDNF